VTPVYVLDDLFDIAACVIKAITWVQVFPGLVYDDLKAIALQNS
jgi:hypothetical protein